MKVYNNYIVTLALVFIGITVGLAIGQVNSLEAYIIGYTIALLVLTAIYTTFSPRARRALILVGVVAFSGFIILVALRVMDALSRS